MPRELKDIFIDEAKREKELAEMINKRTMPGSKGTDYRPEIHDINQVPENINQGYARY